MNSSNVTLSDKNQETLTFKRGSFGFWYPNTLASLVAQLVKNPPAMQETLVRFLGWKDPLEKG